MNILPYLLQFVKTHKNDIVLVIGVVLISLSSFAVGYLVAREELKQPIQIQAVETL